jgi:hypothetical protein
VDSLKFDIQRLQMGSVFGMEPGSPLSITLPKTPLAPGVTAHSIIAVEGDGPLEKETDGVVAYTSAHIEDVDSEFIVRSAHSCQANTHTIQEVRRILLLHAAEACKIQGVCA